MCYNSHLLSHFQKIKWFVVLANAHIYINNGPINADKENQGGKDAGSNSYNS